MIKNTFLDYRKVASASRSFSAPAALLRAVNAADGPNSASTAVRESNANALTSEVHYKKPLSMHDICSHRILPIQGDTRIHQMLKKYLATLKDTMRIAQLLEMAKFKQLWIDAAEVEVLAKQQAGMMPSPGRPSAQKNGARPSGRGTAVLLNRKRWAAPPRTAK